jgi:hypothetical protein
MKSTFKKITVSVSDFSHDVNGNPTAHFSVQGFLTAEQNYPSETVFTTKRRRQIDYSGKVSEYAKLAFAYAEFDANDFEIAGSTGSRSEGSIQILLTVKK